MASAALPATAAAGKRDSRACEAIKPAQQLATSDQARLQAQLSVAMAPNRADAAVDRERSATFDVKQLEDATLTRSWYTYQLCVMKTSGVIPEALYEELLRDTWGLAPAAPSSEPTAPASADACVQVRPVRPPVCLRKRMLDELYWEVMLTNNCSEVVSCTVAGTLTTTVGDAERTERVSQELRWVKPGRSETQNLRGYLRDVPVDWSCRQVTPEFSASPLETVCAFPTGAP